MKEYVIQEPELTEEQEKLQEEIAEILRPYLLAKHTENKSVIISSIVYNVILTMLVDGDSLENISRFFACAAAQCVKDIGVGSPQDKAMVDAGIQ